MPTCASFRGACGEDVRAPAQQNLRKMFGEHAIRQPGQLRTMSPGITTLASCSPRPMGAEDCYVELTIGAECLGASASRINSRRRCHLAIGLLRMVLALARGASCYVELAGTIGIESHTGKARSNVRRARTSRRPAGRRRASQAHQREPAQVPLSFGGWDLVLAAAAVYVAFPPIACHVMTLGARDCRLRTRSRCAALFGATRACWRRRSSRLRGPVYASDESRRAAFGRDR